MKEKTILLLGLIFLFNTLIFCQTEKVEEEIIIGQKQYLSKIENTSNLVYKLVYDQNEKNKARHINPLNVWKLHHVYFTDTELFYFFNDGHAPDFKDSYHLLKITNDTALIEYFAIPDTTLAEVKPVIVWKNEGEKTLNIDDVKITIKFVEDGCMDTQTYSTFFDDKNGGRLSFENFSNCIVFYNSSKKNYYLVFFKFCLNQIKIFKIFDPKQSN